MEKKKAQPDPSKKNLSQVVVVVNKPTQNLAKVHGDEAEVTPFKVPVDQIYNVIKGQETRHPRPLPSNPEGLGAREYCAFRDGMGHHTVDCRSLWRQLQELMNWGYL